MMWLWQRLVEVGGMLSGFWSWLGDLSADVFWSIVTSYPAITLMGALAVASFIVAHMPKLVQRFIPTLALYAQSARLVGLVACAAMMFAFGYHVADGRAEIEQLKNDLVWTEFQLHQQRQVADAADQLRKQADAEKEEAQGQLNAYISKFGKNATDPPPGVVDELRKLQRHPLERRAGAKPRSAVGAAVARVRALSEGRQ